MGDGGWGTGRRGGWGTGRRGGWGTGRRGGWGTGGGEEGGGRDGTEKIPAHSTPDSIVIHPQDHIEFFYSCGKKGEFNLMDFNANFGIICMCNLCMVVQRRALWLTLAR